jgi:hypothetical protein
MTRHNHILFSAFISRSISLLASKSVSEFSFMVFSIVNIHQKLFVEFNVGSYLSNITPFLCRVQIKVNRFLETVHPTTNLFTLRQKHI